jgi:hypothetical protein
MRVSSIGKALVLCTAAAPAAVAQAQIRFGDLSARTGYWLDNWIAHLR